jgi:hypothetical protein
LYHDLDIIFQICDIENLVGVSKTLAKFVKFTPKKTRNFKISQKFNKLNKKIKKKEKKHWPALDGLET